LSSGSASSVAIADRQAVERAALEQAVGLGRGRSRPSADVLDVEALGVLGEVVPDADRLHRIVLPQHLDRAALALRVDQARGEGAGLDDLAIAESTLPKTEP
jgi:hypothetical protein